MTEELNRLIKNSERILLTSHISPDPDAVCSLLLAGLSLQKTFPGKIVSMVLEEKLPDMDFLESYDKIQFKTLLNAIEDFKPDLLIMLDGMNYERFSRHDAVLIRKLFKRQKTKQIIIDHHEQVNVERVDLYIHRGSPATTQDIYWLFFSELNYKKPAGYADTTLTGIYADTGGFIYKNKLHRETFGIASDLIDEGASLEKIQSRLNHYKPGHLAVLAELMKNVHARSDYTFSFVGDDFTEQWRAGENDSSIMKRASESFVNGYIRNIDDRKWGFIVYPDLTDGTGHYSISLRSEAGVRDVSLIARQLGGGGHIPAAGAKLAAKTVTQAVDKVHVAIAATSK